MKKILLVAAALVIVAVPYVADARCASARTLLISALSVTEILRRDFKNAGLHEETHLLDAFRHSVENRLVVMPQSC